MGLLQWFVPGLTTARRVDIEEAGLGSVLPERGVAHGRVERGPDGGPGMLLAIGSGAGLCFNEAQRWEKSRTRETWVGLSAGEVEPQALERAELIGGHGVELGDGQVWLVPVARVFGLGSVLPASMVLGPDGQTIEHEPLAEFAAASGVAERVMDAYFGQHLDLPEELEPRARIDERETWGIAARALALNYHVDEDAISLLRLFTTQNLLRVIEAFIDVPTMRAVAMAREEAAKKGDGAPMPDGCTS